MKSWTDKLNTGKAYEVKPAPIDIAGMKAGQIMLVPTARMVDDFIRTLPQGVAISSQELRAELAAQYQAEVCCPITTGFHLRTVAEAAYEELVAGASISEITPIWRVLDENAPTIKKLSYDTGFIFKQRELEGLDK